MFGRENQYTNSKDKMVDEARSLLASAAAVAGVDQMLLLPATVNVIYVSALLSPDSLVWVTD